MATVSAEIHDSAVGDMVELLRDAKRQLEPAIASGDRALLDAVTASTLPHWRRLIGVAADAARTMRDSPERIDHCRQLARSSLLPLLIDGPIWSRSYSKPRGYPGDYGIMNFVYDRTDQGIGPYARLCHRLGLDVGACVRTRLHLVIDELADRMGTDGDELSVLSLGCGSAREIAAAIARGEPRRQVRFALLDQDAEALACARGFVNPAIASCPAGLTSALYFRLSYGQLLRNVDMARQWSGQELVYCLGLLDYVPQEQLESLVGALFSLVNPGGVLILGNMKEPSNTFWPLDFILDWPLSYRTERQMLDLADRQGVRRSGLVLEETGNNFVLRLWK